MPRIVFRFRIIFLLNFLLLVHTSAQSPFFKTIALLKNHQPISANAIFQDSKGYLWIAGSMGLIRYDGIESYTFDKDDSIGASPVTAISEDSLARIWIGHKNGSIEYYSDNYFKKFKPEEGLGHSEVSFIKFDSQSVLWFGTLGEGVYYFSGKNRKRLYNINQDEGLNDNYVYAMVESSDNIYIGTDNGIGVLNKNTHKVQTTISMKNGLPDNLVKHLEINGNTLWIGTDDKGICTLDLKTQTFSFIKEWTFGTLNTFTLKTPDDCWISTKNDGVVRIKLENSTLKFTSRYTSLNGLPGNTTQTIFTDREKNIWISCNKELVLGASSAFEFIDQKSEGFEYGSVFSFIMDTKGRYWAATQKGLLCAESDSRGRLKFEKVLQEIKEIQNASISLYQDSKGYIWAGTYGYGVYRIDPETRKYMKFDIKNGLPDNNVLYITGSKNLVWLATAGGGAAVYNIDKQSFATYNINNGLGSNYLYSIFADSKGNTWFALDGKGVSVLKDGILTKHFIPDSLGVNSVYAITEDKFNGLWFLTSDKGILRCHAGKFSFFDETNVLKSNNIRSLIADKSGNIIMAGNEGIQVYLCQLGGFVSFGEERGLSYLEPNLNGVSCDTSGTVWISESTGIIKYSPLQVSQQKVKPNINIDKKLLFFNTFKAGKTHFSYNQNHFTFQYTGLWFQSAEKLNYRYKLENYDYDWSIPSHMRLVTYSNLPPGKYIFKVEVSYEPGQWVNSKDSFFEFSINPPFYKTWWFILFTITLIVLSIFYFIKSRTAHLEKVKEELEIEVQRRTKTIQNQKDEIASQRDEIESQRDFVVTQRDKIAYQHENITASIQCASRIQQAILPPEEDIEMRLRDYFIYNRPMDIVSGDFYWISSKSNRIFIVAADCTGHGVSGAFMSILGISLLNKIVFSNPNLKASEILDLLRDEIKYALRQTGKTGEPQDGMDISLIIIENNKQNYQYAAANNSGYLLRNKELIILPADKMPIGIYPAEVPFVNNSGVLLKDDLIYLCSDGFKDQLGGPTDRKFQSRRLQEMLLNICALPMNEQMDAINKTLKDWKGDAHLNDDVLIMGFRIT